MRVRLLVINSRVFNDEKGPLATARGPFFYVVYYRVDLAFDAINLRK